MLYDSVSTKAATLDFLFDTGGTGGNQLHTTGTHYTNPTTFSAALTLSKVISVADSGAGNYLQLGIVTFILSDDGTNRGYWYSPDYGATAVLLYSESDTAFLTPNEAGFFVDSNSSSDVVYGSLLNWGISSTVP
jgi:hypothetical protein